jgi:hypothetical protein
MMDKAPHIVWFGEQPFCMLEIEQAIQQCDYFIVIGSLARGPILPPTIFRPPSFDSNHFSSFRNQAPLWVLAGFFCGSLRKQTW